MMKKAAIALLYAGIASIIYIFGDDILVWFKHSNNLLLIVVMASIMALFPLIPYPLVGGVIGAALGPALGATVTWTGSTIASIVMFLFVRYGYQEWGQRILLRYTRLNKITVMFERNAFLTIFFARLLPFIPSIFINVYAALSRVSFLAYTIASSIGKIPSMLLFAVVGDSLMSSLENLPITIAVYVIFILITLGVHRLWQRRVLIRNSTLEN